MAYQVFTNTVSIQKAGPVIAAHSLSVESWQWCCLPSVDHGRFNSYSARKAEQGSFC